MTINHNNKTPGSVGLGVKTQKALNGQYPFDLKQLLQQANNITKRNVWTFVQAGAFVFFIAIAMTLLLINFIGTADVAAWSTNQAMVAHIVGLFVMAPLFTGLFMMGVGAAQNKRVLPLDVFRYVPSVIGLALAQMIISLFVQLGFALLILPGIYMHIVTVFALPLIAEKQMPINQAIVLSIKMVNRYLGQFVMLFFMFVALMFLVFFSFGFALIWVLPFYYCVMGVLYVDLFVNDDKDEHTNEPLSEHKRLGDSESKTAGQESTFDA